MTRAALAITFIAVAAALQLAYCAPLQERAGGVQCSDDIFAQSSISLVPYDDPSSQTDLIGLSQHTSDGGQVQVVKSEQDGSTTTLLGVRVRQCSSDHLNQHYTKNKSGPAKIFLENDESKCLVRHGTLPSSNPSQKTHISIEDCNSVDDARQARQFWTLDATNNALSPIVLKNGNIKPLPLVLSSTSPQAVEATRARGGDNYKISIDFTD